MEFDPLVETADTRERALADGEVAAVQNGSEAAHVVDQGVIPPIPVVTST
jgi:hypothetical protein